MRNFIVSDLHGDGNIYDSIMGYLENLAKDSKEEITLYINGDLIDRGPDSARMFLDIMNRTNSDNPFKVVYLGGNHELMMYQTAINGEPLDNSNWYTSNGGDITVEGFNKSSKELMDDVVDYVSDLKLYHKFDEKMDGKNIVLVHAKCPIEVSDTCDVKIKDNNELVYDLVWSRRDNYEDMLGNKDYFTIVGHQPLINRYGFYYFSDQNYMVIDGGCSYYTMGDERYNHVALVEVLDNALEILTFNNNNEIIFGHRFTDGRSTPIDKLEPYRKYLGKKKVLVK